jgi:hypothetical protein
MTALGVRERRYQEAIRLEARRFGLTLRKIPPRRVGDATAKGNEQARDNRSGCASPAGDCG